MEKITRRNAMQSIGVTVLGATGLTSTARASNLEKYHGVAYNPVTHEIYGDASGLITEINGQFHGEIKILEKSFNINQEKPAMMNYTATGNQRRFIQHGKRNSRDYQLKIFATIKESITGYIEYQNSMKIAFSLVKNVPDAKKRLSTHLARTRQTTSKTKSEVHN